MKQKHLTKLLARYRITDGARFKLADFPPDDLAGGIVPHEKAAEALADGVARLAALQETLYATGSHALLCIFQGMDASGKDGTIRHVMTGVNPQGVTITSFKAPSADELAHDFLWRVHASVPARGRIGIFNRSQYEDVLVTRVHPALLDAAGFPGAARGRKFWQHRLEDIAAFEHYLARQNVVILKFYLNLSKPEQKRRLLARINDPGKHWKFSPADLQERAFYKEYDQAFEQATAATATPHAPWYVVPADNKWFAHLVVVEAMVAALSGLDLRLPVAGAEAEGALAAARATLEAE